MSSVPPGTVFSRRYCNQQSGSRLEAGRLRSVEYGLRIPLDLGIQEPRLSSARGTNHAARVPDHLSRQG
jgi:hypothetical protein